MSVKLVSSESELESLRDSWREIYHSNANHSPFQTWEWNFTWWKHFGSPGKLRLLLVEEDGKPIGIAPLFHSNRYLGWPLPHLAFIGRKRSDYLDFLVRDGKQA